MKINRYYIVESSKPWMEAQDLLETTHLFEENRIKVIIDGGWAEDALLGEQTRSHEDLDIAMTHKYVTLARQLLEARGSPDAPRNDSSEWNFVLGNNLVHPVRCLTPEWLVKFYTGYAFDEGDVGDITALCEQFGVDLPDEYIQ
jgi:lincosamide nucleotidyltransferase A/C/D/E